MIYIILQGKTVALMLGSPKSIVARGTVFFMGSKLHNAPMPKDCMRVSIDEIVNESALLPFPISDEMKTLGSALGTHVAWPKHLVVAKDKVLLVYSTCLNYLLIAYINICTTLRNVPKKLW